MAINVTTMGDLVDGRAEQADGTALVFPDARATYRELAALTDHFARAIHGLGVQPGDKVGILMPNRLEFAAALIGIAKLGAIGVPINGRFKTHECGYVLAHGDVRLLLTAGGAGAADYPALIAEVFPELATQDPMALELGAAPLLRQVVDLGGGARPGFLTRADLDAAAARVPLQDVKRLQARVMVRSVALLMYTSGTTARPKGCLLTHEALVRHAGNVARTRFLLTADDVFWDPLPLFHCGGIGPMLGCFSVGATYCHAGHFDADVSLRMLEDERVTVAYPAFETIWLAILNHPRFADADLTSIRLIQNIATPEKLAQFEARMPWARQVTSYGSTECATNLTLPHPDDPYEVRIGTLGTPLDGIEVKVVDPESGDERPVGEVGELCFRGYSRFEGYYKDPEQTAATIDAGGWFHTGDLASVDEGGRLIYAGRLKDMLKVGGENVSAVEVEDYLARHEAVDLVQVVSAPDARYTEVAAAYVQLRPGTETSEDELIDFCIGKIAGYKVPRYVRFVTDWPMSGTKIQKYVLRQRIADELEAAGVAQAPRLDARRPVG
ncbi:MAG TPA: AMP-binding protein [Baekduia sp.]